MYTRGRCTNINYLCANWKFATSVLRPRTNQKFEPLCFVDSKDLMANKSSVPKICSPCTEGNANRRFAKQSGHLRFALSESPKVLHLFVKLLCKSVTLVPVYGPLIPKICKVFTESIIVPKVKTISGAFVTLQ